MAINVNKIVGPPQSVEEAIAKLRDDSNWHPRGDGTVARHHPSRLGVEGTEERLEAGPRNFVHIFQDAEFGGGWCVWLNTEVSDFDGLCIGLGKSRDEAVRDAVSVLKAATEALQGPSPTALNGGGA
jgi:hypothetical protein